MFEFFIALFGGLFYGGKYLSERQDKRASEARNSDFQNIQKQISSPCCFEYEPPRTYEAFRIMINEIGSDLLYVIGEGWEKHCLSEFHIIGKPFDVHVRTHTQRGFENIPAIAYEIWLSSKGYLPPTRFYYNYITPIYGYNRPSTEEEREITKKACQVIEKNLQKAHPDLPLRLRISDPSIRDNCWVWEHCVKNYNGTLLGTPW